MLRDRELDLLGGETRLSGQEHILDSDDADSGTGEEGVRSSS
jgi:hypothetical protein